MAAPTRTETLNTLFASTLPHFDKRVYDGVFRGHNVLKLVIDKWGTKTEGGEDVRWPFQYQNDMSVKRMTSPSDTVDLVNPDPILQAGDDWAYYTVGLKIPDTEITDNMGEAKIFDLMKSKTDLAKNALDEYVEDDLLAATTATNGLNSLHATVGTSAQTIHRVNQSTYTAFDSIRINAASGNTTDVFLNHMRNGFYQCSRSQGVDEPDIALMSLTTYDLWGRYVDSRQFIIGDDSNRVAKPMRFWGLEFKWNNNYINNTSALLLNSKYIKCYISSDSRDNGKWQRPNNALVSTRILHIRCQVVLTEPARHCHIHTLVAA